MGDSPIPNAKPFQKGVSGNPGGRPKQMITEAREAHRDDVPKLISVCVRLGLGEQVAGYEDIKARDRAPFLKEALDRLLGKAQQHIELGGVVKTAPAINLAPLTDEELRVLSGLDVPTETDADGEGQPETTH